MKLLITVTALFLAGVLAEEFSCPKLNCENPSINGPVTYDLCWSSDMQQPMRSMISFNCGWYPENEKSNFDLNSNTICGVDLLSNEFAWVDENTQDETKSAVEDSQ